MVQDGRQLHSVPRKAQKSARRGFLWYATFINLVCIPLCYLAETFVGERHWLTTMFTYVPQQILVLPLGFLLFFTLVLRCWRLCGWNLLAGAIAGVTMLGFNIPLPHRVPSGTPLRVMTFNVHQLSAGVERIAAIVEREQPDVLCVQEANARGSHAPSQVLIHRMHGWYCAGAADVATFSRYPIRHTAVHHVQGTSRVMLETVLDVRGKPLTVVNIHMSVAAMPESIMHRRSSLPNYLRGTTRRRSAQVQVMRQLASRSPHPMLLAGDFNTPPRGVLYCRLCHDFRDAYRTAGWGSGFSYPSRLPVMRIDLIFATPELGVRRCYRAERTASDHYPMVADLVVP